MNSSKFTISLLLLIVFAINISAQTVTTSRNFMFPFFFKGTKTGKALLVNGVNLDDDKGADIAVSFLTETLSFAANRMSGGITGQMERLNAGRKLGDDKMSVVDKRIQDLKGKKVQLPRMAKFKRTDAVYLQYDSGKWCIIPDGKSLRVIRDDILDPMIRTDIPSDAGNVLCNNPDGFYLAPGGTVYINYSSNNTNDSWYGIGFGDSYCGIPNEALWQNLVNGAFTRLSNLKWTRQGTLITDYGVGIGRGRKDRGVCTMDIVNDIGVSNENKTFYRNILFPDHFKTSGHGAALVVTAKGTNVMGNVLTTNTAEYLAGVFGIPFYGTGALLVAALDEPDTSLPRMMKRSDNDTVYLQFDDGNYCAMSNPSLLSVMRGGVLAVATNNSMPLNVQPSSIKLCGFPDGFFKAPDNSPQVYYLFSSATNNAAWYGMGFGDSYCKIPNETTWRTLISFAGGDGGAPQESLIRVPLNNLFQGRTEKPCPAKVINGVAS